MGVLVLAGTEVMFFLVAGAVLRFGFRRRTTLLTPRCLGAAEQCLHRAKDSASCCPGVHEERGRERGQHSWPRLATGISRTGGILQTQNWGGWPGGQPLLGDGLGISGRVVSNRIVHHLFYSLLSLLLLLFSLPFLSYWTVFISAHELLPSFFLFLNSHSHPTVGGASKRLRGAELAAGLNHSRPFGTQRGARRVEVTTELSRAR